MTEILKVVIDTENDVETIMNDWCWCFDQNEDFVRDCKANEDGSITGIFNNLEDRIPFEELKMELKKKYRSLEYLGNGNYKCEEYREWNTLTDEEKDFALRKCKNS